MNEQRVRLERDGDVGVIVIDSPPINSGSSAVRSGLLLALTNEAALLLAEGVAAHATDVDLALVNGYGLPRWEGGVVFWARERGEAALRADFEWLARVSGPGAKTGDPRALLIYPT